MTFIDSIKTYRVQFFIAFILLAGLYYPVIPSMVGQWYYDPNYSHGFIVPLIAGYIAWQRLSELKKAEVSPSINGLFIMIAGLFVLIAAFVGTEYFTMRASLIIVLAGITLFFFGKQVFSMLTLPICYLFFMVPLPYIVYDAVAFPLKLFVTKVSVLFLKAIGIVVVREGNIIMFSSTVLEVADACSGIRSLVSLLALSVAFAYFSQSSNLKRSLLVISAVPIAIFANAVRVIITGILAQHWGAKAAEGFFHEFAGMAVFGVAIAMLVATGMLLRRIRR